MRFLVGALLLLGAGIAVADEVKPEPPTACAVYATGLKAQRDELEARLANAVAEVEKLRQQVKAPLPPPVTP